MTATAMTFYVKNEPRMDRYGRPNFSWSARCCRTFHRLSGECRIEGVPRLIDESLPGALGCRAGRSAWAQI